MKKILVTGLCTLHWGRLQYGNIGNYYIVEPLFRQLHEHFADYEILTTFQMDDKFIEREKITVLPMELYYAWNGSCDVENAKADVDAALRYVENAAEELTPWGKLVADCEYIIDVSGDMWGDNAEHVGHDRFMVDCLKMQTAQILGRKTILYAVTPGPFSDMETRELAEHVFTSFDRVMIREKISEKNLEKWGIATDNVTWIPCPSFLFEANGGYQSKWTEQIQASQKTGRKVIGLTFGGFNMPCGPYDMWPRPDEQYEVFVDLAEYMIENLQGDIVLFSHTNGFDLPPHFKLKSGRDFVILEQLYQILIKKHPAYQEHIVFINEPLLPCDIKQVISKFDMLVTGRVHASVAATSQCVPTVYMEYDGRVIYSDKMSGFSSIMNMDRFVCKPEEPEMIKQKVKECYENLAQVRAQLEERVPIVKGLAVEAFEEIKRI